MRFNPNKSLLAGRGNATSRASLEKALDEAQAVLLVLDAGGQGDSYSYTQGDGTRSTTFTKANREGLAAAIQLMQAQLKIVPNPRQAMRLNLSERR